MDFALTEEQAKIQAMVKEFAEKDLAPTVVERDEKGEFPMELFKKLGKTGAYGLPYPKEVGGLGGSYFFVLRLGIHCEHGGSECEDCYKLFHWVIRY